ncbi:chorismate mutase [Insolitispirillum peregrinum]|uniref:chorismate mutase n=1 Tax=Insolitispirillum peregrinum TaxID=80876 RepID=A0A1N7PK07_9PROT|nr:chorismate mutase [Insolitispirillum peregrinum]SIT10837.1 isochorismate pyruvate lyase [Insolitispirillum peregrinum]
MTLTKPQAVQCQSLTEIREQIDRMDRLIVPLLAERLSYVAQAAAFKPTRADAVVPWRVEDVVSKAKSHAAECGMDLPTIEAIYRALVAASIAHEEQVWDTLNTKE